MTTSQKFGISIFCCFILFFCFFYVFVSYAHQGCIYVLKNIKKLKKHLLLSMF